MKKSSKKKFKVYLSLEFDEKLYKNRHGNKLTNSEVKNYINYWLSTPDSRPKAIQVEVA